MKKIYEMIISNDNEMRLLGAIMLASKGKEKVIKFLDKYGKKIDPGGYQLFINKTIKFKKATNHNYIKKDDYMIYCGHCLSMFPPSTIKPGNGIPITEL